MFRRKESKNKERGQTFTELALTMPILLVLFFGLIEIGFAIHSNIVVVNATREGARFGARGVHIPSDDITSIVETGLSNSLPVTLYGAEANTTIIVTQIDLDEDGSYVIYNRSIHGDLAVVSEICEPKDKPCDVSRLDVDDFIDANLAFNASPELCQETAGCNGDFIVVEVFHLQDTVIVSGFVREFIPYPFPINSITVMRVLHHRAPL